MSRASRYRINPAGLPFLKVFIPFAAGIVLYDAGALNFTYTPFALPAALSVSLAAALLASYSRGIHPLVPASRLLSWSVFFCLSAACICFCGDETKASGWFGHSTERGASYVVRISRMPEPRARSVRAEVSILGRLQADSIFTPLSGKAMLYLRPGPEADELRTGDRLLIPGNWQPITNRNTPFAFDYRKFAARKGIHHSQFLPGGSFIHVYRGSFRDLGIIAYTHHWCMQRLARHITDRHTLGLLQAMLVGDERNLDDDIRQAYSETGIIHVVAISGSHIMMLFSFITILLCWLRHRKYLALKHLLALPLIWFYVLISGAPPSAVRAAIMFSVWSLGILLDRERNPLNQLLATAFILLCFRPMWLFSIGFQLSFTAVLSLTLFFRPIAALLRIRNKPLRMLWEAACASLAAEILIAPLVIFYFHNFPVSFLPANLIAWLLAGLVMLGGMLLIAFADVPEATEFLALLLTHTIRHFNEVIFFLQKMNPDACNYLMLRLPELCLLYTFISGMAVYFLGRVRQAMLPAYAALSLLIVSLSVDRLRLTRQERLLVYESGGDCRILLVSGLKHRLLSRSPQEEGAPDQILEAAVTGWKAWRRQDLQSADTGGAWHIAGRHIISPDTDILFSNAAPFPTEVLLLQGRSIRATPDELIKTFSPKQVVACGGQSSATIRQWRQRFEAQGIPFHHVKTQGAFLAE